MNLNKREILLITILFIYTLINVFYFVKYKNCKDLYSKLKDKNFQQIKILNESIDLKKEYFLLVSISIINKHDKIQFSVENPDLINELKEGEKIVFYFNENACGACILEILQDLDILANKIGRSKILVTSNLGSKNRPSKSTQFDFKHYYIKTFYLNELEQTNKPFIFVLDKTLNIRLLYVPEYYPELQQEYFTKILLNNISI